MILLLEVQKVYVQIYVKENKKTNFMQFFINLIKDYYKINYTP